MSEIRELAMRLPRDIGPTSFPTVTVEYLGFTEDALERLVRAAMREAMMRAAKVAEQPFGKGIGDRDDFWQHRIADAIRAEADSQQPHTEALNAQAAELSRLRDLVREMRESLDDVTRMLEIAFMTDYEPQQGSVGGIAKALIAKADAILKESGEPVSPIK